MFNPALLMYHLSHPLVLLLGDDLVRRPHHSDQHVHQQHRRYHHVQHEHHLKCKLLSIKVGIVGVGTALLTLFLSGLLFLESSVDAQLAS